MDEFITKKGEYNYTTFSLVQSENEIKDKKPLKIFTLVGTEVPEGCMSILDVIDTFKSSDNIFSTRIRKEIKEAYNNNKIVAVQESLIKNGVYDKNKFQKALGRAT